MGVLLTIATVGKEMLAYRTLLVQGRGRLAAF
jgi:hypothetical protein